MKRTATVISSREALAEEDVVTHVGTAGRLQATGPPRAGRPVAALAALGGAGGAPCNPEG